MEPDFDIRLTLPPWLSETVSASSTLRDESGRYSYEPRNVTDGDSSTSWVEGAAGPGIGERLRFSIAPSMAKGKATGFYLIDRIGIINGYAASPELYRANNRVKRIGISYYYDTDYGSIPGPEVLEFVLKETTEMQYIELPKPIPVSSLELTILDVYSGKRYDDTCIAEVKLHAVAEPVADVLSLLPIRK